MYGKNKKWYFLVILSIIWGSSFILIKKGLIGLTPFQLGALRILFSGFFIFVFGFYTIKKITREQWKWLIVSGFLGSFFPAFLFAFAETEIDSAVVSILNSLTPLTTILFGFAVFKITSTKRQVTGVIIGFIGTALLIASGAQLNPTQNYFYAALVVLASILYGLNVNIIKRYLQEVNSVAIAFGNFAAIYVPALIILITSGFFKTEVLSDSQVHESILYVLVLSIFGTAMAKIMFNKLVQMATPVFASSVTYLIPIVALFWGLFDGEGFSVLQIVAALIILLGVYLSNRRK